MFTIINNNRFKKSVL